MKKLVNTMVNGILFAIPLGLVFYVCAKLLRSLEHIVKPLADGMGLQHLLGQFALTALALVVVLLFCLVLGFLLQRAAFLHVMGDTVEGFAVRMIPSLSFLKSMAVEKLDVESGTAWKGILLKEESDWVPAFLVEANAQWATLFIPEAPKGDGGEVRIVPRDSVTYKEVGLVDVRSSLRVYGAGLIAHL